MSIHPDPENGIQNTTERPPPPPPANPSHGPRSARRMEAEDADFEADFDARQATDCGSWDGPPFLDFAFWDRSSGEDGPPQPQDVDDAALEKPPAPERKRTPHSWLREAMGSWARVASGKQK